MFSKIYVRKSHVFRSFFCWFLFLKLMLFCMISGRSLFHMCLHLFQDLNLISTFNLDIVKLMRCFSKSQPLIRQNDNDRNNWRWSADNTFDYQLFGTSIALSGLREEWFCTNDVNCSVQITKLGLLCLLQNNRK